MNPGSIGCGKDGIVRFIMLELNGGLADVSYKQLRYDKARVMRDYESEAVA